MSLQSYKDLIVWQKSFQLAKDIYGLESAQILKTIQEIQKMLRSLYLKLEPSTSNL